MSGQQTGNLVKNGKNLGAILCLDLHDIIAVKLKDVSFFKVSPAEIFSSLQKSDYAHWHASYQKILFEDKHCFFVNTALKRNFFYETILNICNERFFI